MTPFVKQRSKINIYDICFAVSVVAMTGILLAMPYQISTVMSLGTYTIAGCAALAYFKYFLVYARKMPLQGVFVVLLILVSLLALFFSHSSLREDMVALACFLEIPVFMLCGAEMRSKRCVETFVWAQYILSFYYIYLSSTDKAHFYQGPYDSIMMEELTLSYHNPNEAAIYLSCCFITLLVAIKMKKQLWLKLLFGINAVLIFRLIWLTQSRAGIVVVAGATLFFLFEKRLTVKKFFTRIALAFPIIMVMLIYFFNEQLVELQFLGSSVESGRINVFNQVFGSLDFYEIFIGDFATHYFNNLHNIYISVFATIGIFGVVLYILFLNRALLSVRENSVNSPYQKMAYVGVLMLIIHSAVEASLFVSGSAFALCFIGIYSLFVFREEDNDFEDDLEGSEVVAWGKAV